MLGKKFIKNINFKEIRVQVAKVIKGNSHIYTHVFRFVYTYTFWHCHLAGRNHKRTTTKNFMTVLKQMDAKNQNCSFDQDGWKKYYTSV